MKLCRLQAEVRLLLAASAAGSQAAEAAASALAAVALAKGNAFYRMFHVKRQLVSFAYEQVDVSLYGAVQ